MNRADQIKKTLTIVVGRSSSGPTSAPRKRKRSRSRPTRRSSEHRRRGAINAPAEAAGDLPPTDRKERER